MSGAIHFVANNVPGFGQIDGRCLPCLGVSGKAASFSPYSSHGYCETFSQISIVSLKYTKSLSSVCKAGQSGYRRNPDFSRQNKHGFSRSRNRQNKESDGSEILEESNPLPSKNGPLLSISTSPNFHATSTPGPREKEIVELFRKVQAQLRERAAIKEEKKMELQGRGKENDTVDSLLHLLRKHATQQGKSNSRSSSRDFSLDQPEENGLLDDDRSTSLADLVNGVKDEPKAQEPPIANRPISNFRRRSPIPEAKIQPNSVLNMSLDYKKERIAFEPEMEHEPKSELEAELIFSDGDMFGGMIKDDGTSDAEEGYSEDDAEDQKPPPDRDLSELKLADLRALAKSRGIKGFSKLKKHDLVQLLCEASD